MDDKFELFKEKLLFEIELNHKTDIKSRFLIDGDDIPVKTILTEADIPFVSCDGYRLDDSYYFDRMEIDRLSNELLLNLLNKVGNDPDKASEGVIIINNLDYLFDRNKYLILGLGKFLDDDKRTINYNGKEYTIDLTKLTVIFTGEFSDKKDFHDMEYISAHCIHYEIGRKDMPHHSQK